MEFEFVTVSQDGLSEEVPIPAEDVAQAMRLAKEQKGLAVRGYLDGNLGLEPLSQDQKVVIEADGVMAIIYQLSHMEKYRGMRIDAIEVSTPH